VKTPTIVIAVLAASTAHADDDRCAAGLAFARKGDLPRAALYLDGCSGDAQTRAAADVARKLRASDYSALTITTTPEGMIGETDALPGERFTTPATIWTRAGTYEVHVAHDATALTGGGAITNVARVEPRSRGSVIIAAPPKAGAPRAGKADFTEDTPEQTAHEGPPPAVKHGTMLPGKYHERAQPAPGEAQLEDPFASVDHGGVSWRLGARVAAGVVDDAGAHVGLGVALTAMRPLDGPALFAARLDWRHGALDAIGASAGFALRLVETRSLVLLAGAAMRGEARIQDTLDMKPVARAGIGGAVDLDLAILRLPLSIGLRFEQGFNELVPGERNRAALFELGYDWR
jgi:hypothetical protein